MAKGVGEDRGVFPGMIDGDAPAWDLVIAHGHEEIGAGGRQGVGRFRAQEAFEFFWRGQV